jgi:RNA polymerase sigma factor (sigma-70 family)
MTDTTQRGALTALLTAGYADLRRRLARRLGTLDGASEVLHETYLRLAGTDGAVPVANPAAYLLRTALNVASDRRRDEERYISAVELHDLWRLGDDAIDPETIAAARAEMEQFKAALSELPARCRAILIAARVDGLSHQAIADAFGISTRMVQFELRRALEHCAGRLGRKVVRRFGPRPRQPS